MADNAEYIKFMDKNLPNNRDPRADGAAEIRAVKTALHNSFPNVDAPVTATAAQMNNIFQQGMQPGMIVMWSGSEDNIPSGWALCNGQTVGTQITPDLRGKFIMGWNPARSGVQPEDVVNIKDKSSLASHYDTDLSRYLVSEPYALTEAQLPAHSHGFKWENGGPKTSDKLGVIGNNKASEGRALVPPGFPGGDGGNDFKIAETGKGDAHSHKLVAAADGKNKFDKRPDWFALAFIMYTGVFQL